MRMNEQKLRESLAQIGADEITTEEAIRDFREREELLNRAAEREGKILYKVTKEIAISLTALFGLVTFVAFWFRENPAKAVGGTAIVMILFFCSICIYTRKKER